MNYYEKIKYWHNLMNKNILFFIIICQILFILVKCRKEAYNVNITERGIRLDPLFVEAPAPGKNSFVYKGYVDYPTNELLDLCPSVKKKQDKQSVTCNSRLDCGPAEVCINDGVSSYCQCSISNDCIESGVC